jgi:hypothetical protein
MGKAWGIIGGFLMGVVVMMVISILMFMIGVGLLPSSEGMSDGTSSNSLPSGGSIALLVFGYFAGWVASIYFGYGFSYDTGYADCKNEPV